MSPDNNNPDPLDLWRRYLDPTPILNYPLARRLSTLVGAGERLDAVENFLGTVSYDHPQDGLAVAEMVVAYALAVLDHFGRADKESPTPPITTLKMALLVVGNLRGVVHGHINEWRLAAYDDVPAAEIATPTSSDVLTGDLMVDRAKFSVTYKRKSCKLGNSRAFCLLERLAQSPGIYVAISTLIQDVWKGKEVSDEAVQRQASILRVALRNAGIEGVIIDGSQPGHYCLILR